MDQKVLARYSLELMEDGKYRVEVDWGDLSNSQLYSFITAIVDLPDALHAKVRSLLSDVSLENNQKSLVDAFLKKNDRYRAKAQSTVFRSNKIAQYHFSHSHNQFSGEEDE